MAEAVVNDEMSSRQKKPTAANRPLEVSRSPLSAEAVAAFLDGLAEMLAERIVTGEAEHE